MILGVLASREVGVLAFSQLDRTVATLRISLAELQDKERQLDSMIAQFRAQLRRLPRQVIYGGTALDVSLNAMGEIEERLADAVANRKRVLAIKKTAIEELEALESVKQLDEARRSLQELKQRARSSTDPSSTDLSSTDPPEDGETLEEIRRLEQFIAEHSKRAELAITARYREDEER